MTDQEFVSKMNWIGILWVAIAPALATGLLIIYPLYGWITAPKLVQTCYITFYDDGKYEFKYTLMGRIQWDTDIIIAKETTFEKTKEKADQINCEIH